MVAHLRKRWGRRGRVCRHRDPDLIGLVVGGVAVHVHAGHPLDARQRRRVLWQTDRRLRPRQSQDLGGRLQRHALEAGDRGRRQAERGRRGWRQRWRRRPLRNHVNRRISADEWFTVIVHDPLDVDRVPSGVDECRIDLHSVRRRHRCRRRYRCGQGRQAHVVAEPRWRLGLDPVHVDVAGQVRTRG